ncbi:hypothetical protein WJX72_004664 [[Myrmecia] bisecta]|uniref:Uncharacterized protein n=1 Tax=[Myrmecia] bisecta TaxID=41462 RepID=A0AAW1R6T3_9CHLO
MQEVRLHSPVGLQSLTRSVSGTGGLIDLTTSAPSAPATGCWSGSVGQRLTTSTILSRCMGDRAGTGSQPQLPSLWKLAAKRNLVLEDVLPLLPIVHRYRYSSLPALDIIFIRLYSNCRTQTEKRRVDAVADQLARNVTRR